MPELFLEILSEEIPSRFQNRATDDLKRLILNSFKALELDYENAETFSTPRRLSLVVSGVAKEIPSRTEEIRGPRVGSPQKAIDGFLKSIGQSEDSLIVRNDKKGDFYYGLVSRQSRSSVEVISKSITEVINGFPWEKSMRWGTSNFRWVRPIHSIACILSDQNGFEILDLSINGIVASNISYGHRFLSSEPFEIKSFNDYRSKLRDAKVMLDRKARSEKILKDATDLALAHGLELIQDEKLLEEIVGLVEWPVVLIGSIESQFLKLPKEVLRVSMREHQKFFSVKNPNSGLITSYIAVANTVTSDDCKKVLEGNAKVLNARLSDAEFFWQNDIKFIKEYGFVKMGDPLKNVVFHDKLGSQAERVSRIIDLSSVIGELIGAEPSDTRKAATVCKIDLVSEMVYEFPELQGIVGFYYAKQDGMSDKVANSCISHYSPIGPSDNVPTDLTAISVALADKIDTLTNFWAINEKPTGSKDPYALRRTAIGIIRILLENELKVAPKKLFRLGNSGCDFRDLESFFDERLLVLFKERGLRSDVLNACYLKNEDNYYCELEIKVIAVQNFVSTSRGFDLLRGYKRAVNILSVEESKDGVEYSLDPKAEIMVCKEEKELFEKLCSVEVIIKREMEKGEIERVMISLSSLKTPIDEFFDKVQVNDKSPIVRRNRLCLLHQIKVVMHEVANFSVIDS